VIWTLAKSLQLAEAVAAGGLVVAVAANTWFRSARKVQKAVRPGLEAEIVDALSVYLGGNRDLTQLRTLTANYPEEVQRIVLRYQTVVAGRREELAELSIHLGFVQRWCHQMHSKQLVERQQAFACVAAVAHYEPVRRFIGNIPSTAFRDPDEQIRLEAARILIAAEDPAELVRVFEALLTDTATVRDAIAPELSRHAILLCEEAIPKALRARDPRNVLRLVLTWERALPLRNVMLLAEHPDAEVRVEAMRLMPLLPSTADNRAALQLGTTDTAPEVREAAVVAVNRLKPVALQTNALEFLPAGGSC
jgi:hypothetical protein